MITIRLTQPAYICDGDYRLPHSVEVVWGPYYRASAKDDNGSACDWANPVAVVDIDNNAEITGYKLVL